MPEIVMRKIVITTKMKKMTRMMILRMSYQSKAVTGKVNFYL